MLQSARAHAVCLPILLLTLLACGVGAFDGEFDGTATSTSTLMVPNAKGDLVEHSETDVERPVSISIERDATQGSFEFEGCKLRFSVTKSTLDEAYLEPGQSCTLKFAGTPLKVTVKGRGSTNRNRALLDFELRGESTDPAAKGTYRLVVHAKRRK